MSKAANITEEIITKILMIMLSGARPETVRHGAITKLELTPAQADTAIEEARRRITLAAEVNQHKELAEAIEKLQDLYNKAHSVEDVKTCLAILKERNKLLALYGLTDNLDPAGKTTDPAGAELEEIRAHLAPLGFDGDTVVEMLRLLITDYMKAKAKE